MRKDPTEFRARFKAYKEGKMPYENGLPRYEDGTSNIIQYDEDTRDQSEYGEDTADRLLYYVRDPLTVSKNVIQSILHPKGVVERIMRQGSGGVRSVNDVIEGIFLNRGGDYTGYVPGHNSTESSYDRDLVGLYLYGNDRGFQKIDASDNIGHSYDKEIISSGRDPKNISTYYGRFPVNKEIILPKYAEKNVKALIDSGITTTIPLHSYPKSGSDDVARFLATLSMKNNKPVVSYSDMWDFIPEQYNQEYGSGFFENMQSYIADKSGTPFILRQNVPIKFDDVQYDINDQEDYYTVRGKDHNLADEILLRSGIIPEVIVYPSKKPSKRKIRQRQNK